MNEQRENFSFGCAVFFIGGRERSIRCDDNDFKENYDKSKQQHRALLMLHFPLSSHP